MDITKDFKIAAEDGYDKEDVLHYIEELERDSQTAQEDLKNQIENLAQSRDELSHEVASFSEHVGELEQKLSEEKERVRVAAGLRDHLYTELEHKQQELDAEILARKSDVAACELEIANYLKEKQEMQAQMEALSHQSKKYEEVRASLKRIRMNAEMEAFRMVEEAKEQSMDAISVVDDVAREIHIFKEDIKQLREDIHIGPDTAEDRLNALYYTLENYMDKLTGIKERFYAAHHIPAEEGYDYMDIVGSEAKQDCACAAEQQEAAEEMPVRAQPSHNPLPPAEKPQTTKRKKALHLAEFGEAADEIKTEEV